MGDVLLHVSFRGQNGTNYLSKPLRIVRREPPGATPVALLVDPTDLSLPVGADFPLTLGLQYADGSSRMAFAAPGEIVISGQTNSVVDVSKPQRWRVVGVGTAQLTVHHADLTAQVTVTGFQPDQPYQVPLEIERVGTNQVGLTWPMGAPGILERAGPELGASWIAATNATGVIEDIAPNRHREIDRSSGNSLGLAPGDQPLDFRAIDAVQSSVPRAFLPRVQVGRLGRQCLGSIPVFDLAVKIEITVGVFRELWAPPQRGQILVVALKLQFVERLLGDRECRDVFGRFLAAWS